jgi:hypothetical protein
MERRFGTGKVLAGGVVLLAVAAGLWSAAGREARAPGPAPETPRVDATPRQAALFRVAGPATPAGTPQPVAISREAVRQAMRSGTLPVVLPDGTRYTVAMTREETSPGGQWTAIGHVRTAVGRQAMVLTFGLDAVFGVLPRPDGFQFQLTTTRGVTTLAPAGGIRPPGESIASMPDMLLPPRPGASTPATAMSLEPTALPVSAPPAPVEIDVLALYTADHATLRGSDAAAETEVTNLFATANQSYLESGTGVTMRVRRIARVMVGETLTNHQVLSAITDNAVAGADIHGLRDSLAADLVALVRPSRDTHGSCGVAWMNGGELAPNYVDPMWGYSVTNIAPCGPHVLAHELGHNLGSAHDRVTMTSDGNVGHGAWPFSFGFRQDGPPAFGTVMAYVAGTQRWIGLFSDPSSSGCGALCGVADYADNVHSIRAMAPRIARFRNPPGSLAIEDAQLLEGDGGEVWARFRIHLSGPAPAGGVAFDFATVGGTAAPGADFEAAAYPNVSIAEGEREAWLSVRIAPDDVVEPDEAFTVRLSNVVGATLFDGEAVATIVNDDPRVVVSGRVVFPLGMAPPTQPFAVHATGPDGQGWDAQHVMVGPPDYRYRFAVARGSRIELTAFPPAPFIRAAANLGWIHHDRPYDIEAARGVAVNVRLRPAEGQPTPTGPVDIHLTETIDGRYFGSWSYAASPPDFAFTHVASTRSYIGMSIQPPSPLQPQRVVLQRLAADTHVEVLLHATQPGVHVWGSQDPLEGSGNAGNATEAIVQLTSPAPAGGVRVDYATVAGTATAGSDYTPVSGTLHFAEGETLQRVPITLVGDDHREAVETFSVRLGNVTGAVPGSTEFRFYIVDDDARTGGGLQPDQSP